MKADPGREKGAPIAPTTLGWMESLTLTLSPLRGAREQANRRVAVSRCAAKMPGVNFGVAARIRPANVRD